MGIAAVLCALVVSLVWFPAAAQAGDVGLSSSTESPDRLGLSSSWAAWDDYSVDPAVVHWQNLQTASKGTVDIPGLNGRKGSQWAIGDGFVAWHIWSDGPEAGLYLEDLLTHEQRKISASTEVAGFVTDGSLVYWDSGDLLRCLNVSTGTTKTFAGLGDAYDFDVGGEWVAWTTFDEVNPDAPEFAGYHGTVHARNLATSEQMVLGSFYWGTMQEPPPVPMVDGHWVVWSGYASQVASYTFPDKTAYAYDLQARKAVALDDRIGPSQIPYGLEVSGGWLGWMDARGTIYTRAHVMNLSDPTSVPVPVAKTAGNQYSVLANSSWVVWLDDRAGADAHSVRARRVGDTPADAFSDIADSGCETAIEDLTAAGVIGGYRDGTFRPENAVLRAQFAKMLVGGLQLEVSEGAETMPFLDVERPESDLYPDDYVATAYHNGIVSGFSPTRFGPYQPVTRIQMVSMVVRALERLRPGRLVHPPAGWDGSEYPEANDPTHGANVRLAEYNGLLSHWPYYWGLYQSATRGEMAQILWDALGGEFSARRDGLKSAKSLDQVETQLRSQLDPSASIYLPSHLPSGWAIADLPLPADAEWDLLQNPEVNGGDTSYKAAFTNGASVITLWTNSDLADPGEASTADLPTDLLFESGKVGMLYMEGIPVAFAFTTGAPRGWILVGSKPWDRESVLEFAAAMKRVR